jgi:5-methyltetrahydrofolate--homocysteine methyltransferase
MRETLAELRRHGIFKPVVLGGAALTRRFAEVDCAVAYGHAVAWARDAFDGLRFMEEIERAREEGRYTPWHLAAGLPPAEPERHEPEVERRLIAPAEPPTPPFLGAGVPARLGVDALLPFLDRRRLFEVQWGFQQGRLDPAAHEARRRELVEPLLEDRLERWARLLEARAVYGYFRARGERGAILLLDPHAATEILARIPSGRLRGRPLTDYIAREDLVALQAVTLDAALGEAAHAMHARGEFRDYLLLHGLGAALAEAAAAALHARIRAEWGIAPDQGRRLSPGYPALPDLGSQSDLLRLLDAGRVGLSLNDALQLEPEHATTALVFHHPALRS